MGSCLTLGNESFEERSAVQVRVFIGKGCRGRGRGLRGMERTALPRASQSQVLWSLG